MAISGNARLLRERRNAPVWKPEGLRECSDVKAGGPDVSDFCEGPFAGIGASAALLVFNAVSEMGFFKKAVHVQSHGLSFSEAPGCIPQSRKRFFIGWRFSFFNRGCFHKVPPPPAFEKYRPVVRNVCQRQTQGFLGAGGAYPAEFPPAGEERSSSLNSLASREKDSPAFSRSSSVSAVCRTWASSLFRVARKMCLVFRRSGGVSWSRIRL